MRHSIDFVLALIFDLCIGYDKRTHSLVDKVPDDKSKQQVFIQSSFSFELSTKILLSNAIKTRFFLFPIKSRKAGRRV